MIDDDRFVSGSYGNWDFGVDNTGNLMSWPNVEQLRRKAAEMGPVHLVNGKLFYRCVYHAWSAFFPNVCQLA